jgi:ATP-dependent exoDNAse (exonuclease V) beta subunit
MVPLDATPEQINGVTDTQARILAASPDEVATARRMVEALLGHPLLLRAQAAWKLGKCRRETPIAWVAPDGLLVEGVLDLAFEGKDNWIVLDFKTDKELGAAETHYRRQVGFYTSALERVTGRKAKGLLIRL